MTGTDLVVQSDDLVHPATLFGTDNPGEVVERAAVVAKTLADLVHKQNLVVQIQQSSHVRVEGWTLLGSMLGVFPIVVWTRQVMRDEQPFGWEARVEARTRAGEVVGAAEAECLRDENQWSFEPVGRNGRKLPPRDDYALRSMAQTRAVSKALRLPLGFVMQLAGFNPTPAEEMSRDIVDAEVVESVDADLPEALQGDPQPVLDFITQAQARKLNVLIGKLRGAERDPTGWIYAGYTRAAATVPEGDRSSFAAIRDRLTKLEASTLIESLEGFVEKLP